MSGTDMISGASGGRVFKAVTGRLWTMVSWQVQASVLRPLVARPTPRPQSRLAASAHCRRVSPHIGRMSLLLALALLLLLATVPAMAQKRVALVVGNADYVRAPLVNPVNDAADLAAALRRLGFEVLERRNRGSEDLKRDLIEFQDKLGPGAVGLFYFAGHGMQAGRGGRNYLLPVGVDYRRERDVELFGLDAGTVLARMEESGASLSLVILDACRDSPLPPEGRTTVSRGLGRMDAPSGSLVAFATAPGSTADENRGGRNGLYTQYLLQAIETPGLRLEDVFQQVRREVERASNRKQSPEEISKLTSAFYFRPAQQAVTMAPPVFATVTPPTAGGGVSLADLERIEQARRSWAQWQQRMQADFDRIVGFQGGADLRAQAWQRFLDAWKDDNPTSEADEGLRVQARQGLGQAQSEAQRQQRVAAGSAPAAAVGAAGIGVAGASQTFKDCEECPEMVVIPAGRFLMGSPQSEPGRLDHEGPQHWVDVPRFAIGKFEVTQRQWEAVMGSNPSTFRDCGPDCPVEPVSWNDAQVFVRRLSQRTGHNYRLPSEAEWEYAARAGTTMAYPWGERASREYANYGADACCGGRAEGRDRWMQTAPVGQFPANAFGLHDMHGNTLEWVQDVWHDSYAGAPSDGSAWETGGDQSLRMLRGGSWEFSPQSLRSAYRFGIAQDGRVAAIGFRIARNVSTTQSSSLLYLNELPESIRLTVPRIRIDGVVQSPIPINKLIIMNGSVYREFETVVPGLRVEIIGPDDAIFNWRGQRFKVKYSE